MAPWVYDPHSGGVKIPERVKARTRQRILDYATYHYAGKFTRLDIRFRGQFCYIDAYTKPDVRPDFPPPGWPESRETYLERLSNTPTHLCRLRYFGDEEAWSLAFFAYSSEKYEPSVFHSGSMHGTPEEAFDVGAVYLQN